MLKKITLLSLLTASTFVGVNTSLQANTLTKLNQCSTVKDSLERLVCYDELVKEVNSGNPSQPATVQTSSELTKPQNLTPVAAPRSAADNFGREHIRSREEIDAVKNIRFTVEEAEQDQYGSWLITFTNGQKWKQTDGTTLRLKPNQEVELQRGVLGAIFLKRLDANKRIRVKRLQ